MLRILKLITFLLSSFASVIQAAPPDGYYASVDLSDRFAFKRSLHNIIDDHVKVPYTSSQLDTWDVIAIADRDPLDAARVLTLYKNATYPAAAGANEFYNREHVWPKSYGFPNDVVSNMPYTDLHHLFAADSSYNSSRSNLPFGYCSADCLEKPTDAHGGIGGNSGVYPGDSNWRQGSGAEGSWEVWLHRRGDVARALFYMAVRYEGDLNGLTGASEPQLELTNRIDLIEGSNTGENISVAYMGRLDALLEWHEQDPVDEKEMARNDAVYAAQGNRNPFIDHPEFVAYVFTADGLGGEDDDEYAGIPIWLLYHATQN